MLRATKAHLIVDGRYAFTIGALEDNVSECASAPPASVTYLHATPTLDSQSPPCARKQRRRRRKVRRHAHESDETRQAIVYASGEVLHVNDTIVIGDDNEIHGNNNKAVGNGNTLIGIRCSARGVANVVAGRGASAIGERNRTIGPGATNIVLKRKNELSLSARIPKTPVTPRWQDITPRTRPRRNSIETSELK